MVSVPSEQGVERSLLSWLDTVGWETHGQDGGRGANVLDETYSRQSNEVIYWDLLEEQIIALNDDITEDNVESFLSSLRRDLDHENLMDGNREFHQLLTKGKRFSVQRPDGSTDSTVIDLVDFETPENNRFHAVNQFSVSRGTTIRPDVTLFINGIPLVTMELKSVAQDNDWFDAVSDLHSYEEDVSRLFVPGLFNIAADTMELRYGAVGAPTEFYEPWTEAPPEYQDPNEMKQAVQALCNRETLLDLLKNFVFYEDRAGGDAKIVPRYMQYYAVNRILDRVREGQHDRGLVWHTQGSGKSYTMLYAAENLLSRSVMDTPQVFIIVDTDKLASQMRDTLANIGFERSVVAESIDHLQRLIEEGQSQLVLTTIQKFEDVEPDSQGNDEVVVMSDEAELDEEFEHEFRGMSTDEKREFIRNNVTATTLAELSPRVDRVVEEIDQHYDEHVAPNGWKGMVVTPSRRSAAMYGERLIESRGEDEVEVLYTATNDDPDLIQQFHTDSEERDQIIKRYKQEADPRLLVVHNMLLTGFDAPVLKTMYLDRNLKNHNLMQAIARTNRPAEGKENGEIVDFQGVFENIDEALDYDAETKAYAARDKDELFDDLVDHLDSVMDIFDGIPKDDTQEATYEAVERVSTHPERREFKQGFRRLQNLYESVAPDGRLIEEGIQDQYKWLSRIHVAFKRTTSGDDTPEEDMREKTRDILEDNIDVGEIRQDFPTYKLGEEYLDDVEGLDNPGVKASQIAHATQDHLHPRTGQNPRYKRLSERVNDIVERWQGGEMGDPEAVEALKSVEEEVLSVANEADERGMADAEFAVYTHLTEETPEAIDSDDQAEAIAEDIVEAFEERVDRDYPDWETNERTTREIERLVLDVLAVEYDLVDLARDDDVVDAIRGYLIENYA